MTNYVVLYLHFTCLGIDFALTCLISMSSLTCWAWNQCYFQQARWAFTWLVFQSLTDFISVLNNNYGCVTALKCYSEEWKPVKTNESHNSGTQWNVLTIQLGKYIIGVVFLCAVKPVDLREMIWVRADEFCSSSLPSLRQKAQQMLCARNKHAFS